MPVKTALPFLFLSFSLLGQVQPMRQLPFIRATGQGSVSIAPDTAIIDLGVITQAATAQDATAQNATQASAVIAALQQLLGANSSVKTISYSVNPNYNYPPNGPQTLLGYTVTNVVEVTVSDLTSVGKVVDTAVQAGANNVQRLQFTLKDDTSARQQALRLASMQAQANAGVIANGLGVHTGAVLAAIEGAAYTPMPVVGVLASGATATPVQPGNLTIQATVTLDLQVTQ
ncbi:MAG: SIMPL domain-containing protein [Bryobacteraceae bacterium]